MLVVKWPSQESKHVGGGAKDKENKKGKTKVHKTTTDNRTAAEFAECIPAVRGQVKVGKIIRTHLSYPHTLPRSPPHPKTAGESLVLART